MAGMPEVSPTTFIISLTDFIPGFYAILYYGCMLFGLLVMSNAFLRQIDTAKGRGEHTLSQNVLHAFFGAGFALVASFIGYIGKGVFGDFHDVSVILHTAKESASISKIAITSFMYVLQFIGSCCCVIGWRHSNLLATGRANQSLSWTAVFFYFSGGLSLVFIQKTIGIVSGMFNMGIAEFINSL